jgi:hypothetical protein
VHNSMGFSTILCVLGIRNVDSMPYIRLSFPSNDTVGFVWRTLYFMRLLVEQVRRDGSISKVESWSTSGSVPGCDSCIRS